MFKKVTDVSQGWTITQVDFLSSRFNQKKNKKINNQQNVLNGGVMHPVAIAIAAPSISHHSQHYTGRLRCNVVD